MKTEQEKRFLDLLYDYAYQTHASGDVTVADIDRSLLDSLYALIDLRINPPKEVPKLKSLEEHNASRSKAYDVMASRNLPRPNGIACPKCGTELIDSDPTMTLASNPPQKNIKCPSCDYVGYRIA